MLKNTITSLFALALTSGSALAVDVSGTYRTQINGQPVAMELVGQGQVKGTLYMGGLRVPVVAQEQNGQMRGFMHRPDGMQVPFMATRSPQGLSVVTPDGQYFLTADGAAAPEGGRPQNQPAVGRDVNVQAGQVPAGVQMMQGQIFAIPVPAGWKMHQTICEAFASDPAGTLGFGFVGLERIPAATPMQFLQQIIEMYQNRNFKLLAVQQIRFEGATDAIEAKFSYTSPAGVATVAWARVCIIQVGGSMNAYMVFAAATPEKFDANVGSLRAMAEKIQVTNVQLAFDRNRAMDNIRLVQNRPMDHSFADDWHKNQKRVGDALQRGSDVRRDRYTSTDPTTGERFTHGQNAHDPARGGVPNPNRPGELLTPEPHWQNRD